MTEPRAASAEVAVLAAALARQTARTFSCLPPERRGEPREAIARFLAAPGPASYLAASRALAAARRREAARRLASANDERGFERALEALGRIPGLGVERVAALGALPRDVQTVRRLRGIALLFEAQLELAARAHAAARALREKLRAGREPKPGAVATAGRRAPVDRT